ncbi:branched-chain-amino-acid transaminase [Streptomyces sp. NPDC101132]|uniref:branched-chain-amino-acid transaminase n=1 Tax=Streptomyces sp. NPDC101132 TaxID=3366110 RepID=UPI00382A05A3
MPAQRTRTRTRSLAEDAARPARIQAASTAPAPPPAATAPAPPPAAAPGPAPAAPSARPGVAPWAYHDGAVVPFAEVGLPLTTQALQYGTAVFEGIRAFAVPGRDELVIFRAHDHYERFLRSCRLLRIEVAATAEELVERTFDLLRRNGIAQDSYLRPLGYKLGLLPGTPAGVRLTGLTDAFSVTQFTLGAYTPSTGITCGVSSWSRPRSSAIPVQAKVTGGYVNSALAAEEARAAGYDDAILLNDRGQVAEASTANVFAVRDGRLLTPPPGADLLPGITRDTVRVLADGMGVDTLERDLGVPDLLQADEVFLTGTGVGITPVTGISGRPVADGTPGPLTRRLVRAYAETVRGAGDPRHDHWLTIVPIERG